MNKYLLIIKLFFVILLTACSTVKSNAEVNNNPYDLTKKITVDLVDKISTDKLNLEETRTLVANEIMPLYHTRYAAFLTLGGKEFKTLNEQEKERYFSTYAQYVSLFTKQILGEVYKSTEKIEISDDKVGSDFKSIPVKFTLKNGTKLSGSYKWRKNTKTTEWQLVDFYFSEDNDDVFDPDKHLALTLNNLYLGSEPFAKKVEILNEWINKLSNN